MSDREEHDKDELAAAEALRRALAAREASKTASPRDEAGGEADAAAPEGVAADAADDPDGLAELADSLRAAYAPKDLSPKAHAEILERVVPAATRGGRVIRVSFGRATFGVVSALAIAAALFLYLRTGKVAPQDGAPIAWARSRSTTPLFEGPFQHGEAVTARIDRIALAREHDFRENRFAARRVR